MKTWSFLSQSIFLSKVFCTFAIKYLPIVVNDASYSRFSNQGQSVACNPWVQGGGMIFEGINNWSVRFLFKTSLKLGREIDVDRINKWMLTLRRGRLSYLLTRAPAKRLRRWISINCPRFSVCAWLVSHVSERITFAFFIINNYGKETATWL